MLGVGVGVGVGEAYVPSSCHRPTVMIQRQQSLQKLVFKPVLILANYVWERRQYLMAIN